MTEAENNKIREEILEIFSELSPENQQALLVYARSALTNESIKNIKPHIELNS